ncbi:bactofilin family protein [Desulfovibrio sp. Fe33]|uniref:bactofilin family protein n=1 Tax=Desulfovibrio sp. Fe33 TaxID=3020842 RepID=UPI00234E286C|nr:polymer-forming cytoskeletal protein [Desulfovibrio sp. Fe33]
MGLFSQEKAKENSELNAFLGVGTEYKGKLEFVGTVRIDGRFEGEITTDGVLILGRKAYIEGLVRVGQLNSCGEIRGEVHVKEKAVFEKTSVLKGSLDTSVLVVEQGALVEGTIHMTGAETMASKPKVVSANFGGSATEPAAGEPDVAKTGSDDGGA